MGTIKQLWRLWVSALRLRVAIFLAESKFLAKNERHYVVPSPHKGKLDVWSTSEFKLLRKPRRNAYRDKNGNIVKRKTSYFNKNYKHHELMNDCLYFTASRIKEKDAITKKEAIARKKLWVNHLEKKGQP